MAENERFEIKKVVKPKECNGCEYDFKTCEITCPHNYGQGKTRKEWENVLYNIILNGIFKSDIVNVKHITSDVCNKLFGKSK